jgi:hypothetical protein
VTPITVFLSQLTEAGGGRNADALQHPSSLTLRKGLP